MLLILVVKEEWSMTAHVSLAPTTTERAAPERLARSALARCGVPAAAEWFRARAEATEIDVRQVPLDELAGWRTDPRTGNISHESGRFFAIRGINVEMPGHAVPAWGQPIIHQPEVGVLGILLKEFDGVPHFLMQAKAEPGNINGVQLSPTVQATRSNYTGAHHGRAVPYLSRFLDAPDDAVVADVRHSEQGAWFYRKLNRNVVVEVTDDLEVLDGFRWFTLGELHRLLAVDNVVNMDARTVLACLPFAYDGLADTFDARGDDFRAALVRSCEPSAPTVHTTSEILRWVSEIRTGTELRTTDVPLAELADWRRTPERVHHRAGVFFDVVGVDVRAPGREVPRWSQPLISPHGVGIVAFLATRVDGVLHVLVHAQAEPGCVDVVELAPTVQCTPQNYGHLPLPARPRFLDVVRFARPQQLRLATTMSEEGGRFLRTRTRYVVVEVDSPDGAEDASYRWVAVHQLVDLLRHSHYMNIQARSLVACLHGLCAPPER
jgi:oxidase EvaA